MKILDLNEGVAALLKNGSPIVIYRAGFNGKVYKNILKSYDISVMCYVEINSKNYPKEFNESPVFSIFDLPIKEEEIILIIAMDQYKIPEQLQFIMDKFRFKDVFIAKEEDIIKYCLNYCTLAFKKKGIDVQNDILDFGFVKLHNPFNENWAYKKAFALQIKDIILPELGYDYLVTEGPYEYDDVCLLKNDVVFDCGANIGLFSNYAAAKGCRVYAFEPAKITAKFFKLNQNLYPNQITLIQKALHIKKGIKQFYTYRDDWGSNSTELELSGFVMHKEYVQTISIDEFVQTNKLSKVNFIKADIEGAERYMLIGAQHVLENYAPSLALCAYHVPDDNKILPELIIKSNPSYCIKHRWEKIYSKFIGGNKNE